jgi:hypothetical protein
VDLSDADSVREWYQRMMNNYQLYMKYKSVIYGANWYSMKANQIFGMFYALFGDATGW